eukprot:6815791-Prymnesium_polylepis.1
MVAPRPKGRRAYHQRSHGCGCVGQAVQPLSPSALPVLPTLTLASDPSVCVVCHCRTCRLGARTPSSVSDPVYHVKDAEHAVSEFDPDFFSMAFPEIFLNGIADLNAD